MRRGLLLTAVVFLSGCGTSVVPEGIYRGTVTSLGRMYLSGELVDQMADENPTTITIGPGGLPMTDDNRPIYVGYTKTLELGGVEMTQTVTSVQSVGNGCTIDYECSALFAFEGGELLMTGFGSRSYIVTSGTTLEVTDGVRLAYMFYDGSRISMAIDSEGEFTR